MESVSTAVQNDIADLLLLSMPNVHILSVASGSLLVVFTVDLNATKAATMTLSDIQEAIDSASQYTFSSTNTVYRTLTQSSEVVQLIAYQTIEVDSRSSDPTCGATCYVPIAGIVLLVLSVSLTALALHLKRKKKLPVQEVQLHAPDTIQGSTGTSVVPIPTESPKVPHLAAVVGFSSVSERPLVTQLPKERGYTPMYMLPQPHQKEEASFGVSLWGVRPAPLFSPTAPTEPVDEHLDQAYGENEAEADRGFEELSDSDQPAFAAVADAPSVVPPL